MSSHRRSLFLAVLVWVQACSGGQHPTRVGSETSASSTQQPLRGDNLFGADANPTGNPLGGGPGYGRILSSGDFRVASAPELVAALGRATSGQVVYVADSARIDLSGMKDIRIPAGVTLASGRGRGGSNGALIFATPLDTYPLFQAGGPGVRVTGLRLQGPDGERRTEQMKQLYAEGRYYSIPNSDGIQSSHPGLEVDNCEIWAWSHGGVYLKAGSTANVHHNDIHHCQREGLGYGVVLDQADAIIEANRFDYCRHHIAGTGRPGTSYEARYNLVLENANSHSFDMHGGVDRGDGTDIAGSLILIHHNTFRAAAVSAVVIRGRPLQIADVYNNVFAQTNSTAAVKQTASSGNVRHYRNQYGPTRAQLD